MKYDLLISNFQSNNAKTEIFRNKELLEIPTKKALTKVYKNIVQALKVQLIANFKKDIKEMDYLTDLNIKMELETITPYILITLDTKENTLQAYNYYAQRKQLINGMNDFIRINYTHLKDYDYTILNIQ